MLRYRLFTGIIGCLLAYGCSSSNENEALKYSDSLIVVSGAKNVHYTKLYGTDQIFYIVKTEYPAISVLQEISQKLQIRGWKPLKEDYLNPGMSSSHVQGWSDFIDMKNNTVYQWLAQWENNNKDIIWCTLRYSYPRKGKVNLNDLTVSLVFIPGKLAVEEKSKILEYNARKDK